LFRAGFGKACISPEAGVPLAGFAARQGVATGVHDDLFVRALALETEDANAALLSVDLLALPREFVERVRRQVNARTGIDPNAILIACTHTHSGPVTISTFFNPDESVNPAYMDRIAEAMEQCVEAAWAARFTARIGVGSARIQGIGMNRRTPDFKPIDEELAVLRVDDAQGRTRVAAVQYSCHPTVLGPDNLLVTGDFPAATLARMESGLGEGAAAMFLNGTQGNISVGHSSELSAIGVITPGRTFERAAEVGRQLGEAALEAVAATVTTERPDLAVSTHTVGLPIKKYPTIEQTAASVNEAEQSLARLNSAQRDELRKAKSDLLYANINHYYARETASFTDGRLPIELQAIRIADAMFVAVPAEVFVEIGLRIKRMSHRKIFTVGVANGYIGYLPNRDAYTAGGYEVVSARVGENSEDELVRGIMVLERSVFAAA
jgi:neutral ceramidase